MIFGPLRWFWEVSDKTKLGPAADLEVMLRGSDGVLVEYGLQSTYGHRDEIDEEAFEDDASVYGSIEQVVVATGLLTGLAVDASITVDGDARVIRDHKRFDDGALTRILLAVP